ncbi:MAG: TonB-dependent receptor [Deferribacteres bacterium]|nr:TonB-dependent receptor [Deferribacteres bacterium]
MRILRMFYKEDELVVTPTRTPKPVSQVAENITVITAKEIEEMNAHTLAEVLERATGLFVEFFGHDFGSDANIYIQGSDENHVLLLIDGMPWNLMNNGKPLVNSIPVKIIRHIEIIKGPASSSWGSSLGGVINVVTKDAGNRTRPGGMVSASYGERDTQDYSIEVSGKAGNVGYYLHAGRQYSRGLRDERYFKSNSFYSKINIPVSQGTHFMLTAGYTEPRINYGDLPALDLTSTALSRAFFATASLSADITEFLSFEASVYTLKQKFVQNNNELSTGDLYMDAVYDEDTTGGSGKFIWRDKMHTAVVGADISDGHLDQTITAGRFLQSFGAPGTSGTTPGIEKWAVFANDTITVGRFSITPGIRLDHNNVSGDFMSPSLGATYKLGRQTILRASVARGFTIPLLIYTSGALYIDPNPDLKPEKVWSYQAGVESWVSDYFHVKAAVFHHNMKDALVDAAPPTENALYVNEGNIKRDGMELDIKTVPFNNISLKTGFAYVHKRLYLEETTSEDNYACNLAVRYDDNSSLSAQLAGNYIWWDRPSEDKAKYNTFIWELNLNKTIYSTDAMNSKFFLTVHNIFNGSHYTLDQRKNPRRWVEAGVRLSF